jgi:integrase
MMAKKHPDQKLTLREAYEKYYDRSEFSAGSHSTFKATLRRWEMHTSNPPVGDATDATMEEFKAGLLAVEPKLSAVTVNGYLKHVRCIFRKIAPPFTGNPGGRDIIPRVPYWKPVKVKWTVPTRIALEDLDRCYIAARTMDVPKMQPAPPAEYWRALLVTAYFTGLRKSDLFALEPKQFDFGQNILRFESKKTGKSMEMPIHPCVAEHVQRILTDGSTVFPHMHHDNGAFTKLWRRMLQRAGVEYFTLHDIRRTAASEIERVKGGMGGVLLQHRLMSVTAVSYLNQLEELGESILAMRVPIAFKHGPAQADRAELKAKEQRETFMRETEFRVPSRPDPTEFEFPDIRFPGSAFQQYCFREQWHQITTRQFYVLQALVKAEGPQNVQQLAEPTYRGRPKSDIPNDRRQWEHRVASVISRLRITLRKHLNLGPDWDPLPCLQKGLGGTWTLFIPPAAKNKGAA